MRARFAGWGSQLGPGRGTGRTRYFVLRYGTTEAVPCTVTLSYYYYITVLTITMRCGDPRVLESGCLVPEVRERLSKDTRPTVGVVHARVGRIVLLNSSVPLRRALSGVTPLAAATADLS